ncbi:MAG: hypothetical protein U0575_16690 [Phycisphaerales bacterium]
MKCTSCGYALWNLPARTCPECGSAFKPSDFSFAPASVRFCCPHCDQQYFGTDAAGQLVPRAFKCVRCGRPVDIDQMILRPIAGVDAGTLTPDDMPWLERRNRTIGRAWVQTIGRAMVAPAALMRAVPEETPPRRAAHFMLANLAIFFLVGNLPAAIVAQGVIRGAMGPRTGATASLRGGVVFIQALTFTSSLVTLLLAALMWVVLAGWLLRLLGVVDASAARTWQAIGFASAAAAPMAIPCGCGHYPGLVWWMVSATIMLGAAHRRSGGRVAAASIIAAVIAIVAQVAANVAISAAAFGSQFASFSSATNTPPLANSGDIGGALRQFTVMQGRWPRHGLELLGNPLQPADFSLGTASAGASSPAIGSTTLVDLETVPGDWPNIAADAASSLPDDVLAHRVGDVVFTYHGIPIDAADPLLWTAVLVKEERFVTPAPTDPIVTFCLDGQVNRIAPDAFAEAVAAQNEERRRLGLRPLPEDLGRVFVGAPAR